MLFSLCMYAEAENDPATFKNVSGVVRNYLLRQKAMMVPPAPRRPAPPPREMWDATIAPQGAWPPTSAVVD